MLMVVRLNSIVQLQWDVGWSQLIYSDSFPVLLHVWLCSDKRGFFFVHFILIL